MMGIDERSANAGDILKHSLLLEVLGRCSWCELTYAETHAGAGRYSAARQPPEGKKESAYQQSAVALGKNKKKNHPPRVWLESGFTHC